jgi:hypothetical protein
VAVDEGNENKQTNEENTVTTKRKKKSNQKPENIKHKQNKQTHPIESV